MMKRFIFCLIAGCSLEAQAAEPTIVDVRRNITMSEDDPVYKDFYINADSGSGLKKNLVVTAVRKINIRDASGANAVGEILVPVGQLKIIAVYDKVAVAREFTLLSRDELPMLEQIGIMTGDRIDLQGAFIDNSKPKIKRKVAETSATATTAVTVVAALTGPAPASPTAPKSPVENARTTQTPQPAVATAKTEPKSSESLEKVADSGNNSVHE